MVDQKTAGVIGKIGNNRGSALIAVLVALFILLAVFFAIFSLGVTRASLLHRSINKTRAGYLAEAGINRLLSIINTSDMKWDNIIGLDTLITYEQSESCRISVSMRGGYFLAKGVGKYKNEMVGLTALIGKMPGRKTNAAIINFPSQYPLVFGGYSSVKGDILAGPESVTSGAIDGISKPLDSLLDGTVRTYAYNNIPEIDKNIIKYYITHFMEMTQYSEKTIPGSWVLSVPEELDGCTCIVVEDNFEINSMIFSEFEREILLYCKGNVEIKGVTRLSGLFTIVSAKSISVIGNSILEGVVLVADDQITIGENTQFGGQAICGYRIEIADNAKVKYPSLLYTYDSGRYGESQISFTEKSVSNVSAIMEPIEGANSNENSILSKDNSAAVSGYLQDWQYSRIEGIFFGITLAHNYWYYKERTTYINWIVDSRIDRMGLGFVPILPVSLMADEDYAIFELYNEEN